MTILTTIRDKIRKLYDAHPDIHVNVTLKRPKRTELKNLSVRIMGVYPHMFQVQYLDNGTKKLFTHQYTEVLTRDVEILELSRASTWKQPAE